jgi:hypothetical protein
MNPFGLIDYHLEKLRVPHLPELFRPDRLSYFQALPQFPARISDSHSHLQNKYMVRSSQKYLNLQRSKDFKVG